MDAYCTSGSSPTPEHVSSLLAFPACDLVLENHGSLFLIRLLFPAGQTWFDENVGITETMTLGGAIICEPRYIEHIMRGSLAHGLVSQ